MPFRPDSWPRVRAVFEQAIALPDAARQPYIDEACGTDDLLRHEVRRLLESHERATDLLSTDGLRALVGPRVDLEGRRLGPYLLEGRLGAGGMGEVYRARDTRLERTVAIKVLPPYLAGDRPARERFELEARAVAALNHPNICTLHDIGEAADPERPGSEPIRFLVMEFVDGTTLDFPGALPLEPSRVAQIAAQICDGLDAAHARGIVHRDLKPLNLMLTPRGQVKILDFGIAKLDPAADGQAPSLATVRTGTGFILGTLPYMSPEQLAGDHLSAASDIFSLGLVIYRLLTGRHPFAPDGQHMQMAALLHALLVNTPRRLHELQPGIPRALDEIVLRMLDRTPAARPSAAEVRRVMLDPEAFAGMGTASQGGQPARRHTVGRQREHAVLDQAYEDADAGRPAFVAISGEPGIGKTTLVEEFLARLRSNGRAYIARGRCSERLVGSEAYLPVLEMLESLLVGDDRHSGAQYMMSRLAPTWYAQVAGRVPSSGVGGQLELRTASQERMKRELRAFFAEASQKKPLVLFLDDLHWSDVSTVDLLGYLCSQFASTRLLIVATYRPTDLLLARHPFAQLKLELSSRGVCRELALGFLSREEAAHYLDLEFPAHTFPAALARVVHEKTEGSPLFLVNLVGDLRDRQVIVQSESGGWRLAQSVPVLERGLPESVRSMIERKIEQLAEEDRQLLVGASVQGHAFDSAVVARALGRDAAAVEERLEILDRVHAFVQVVGDDTLPDGTPTLRCRFVHVLYQNALFASLRATRRTSLSAAVAAALIAFHRDRDAAIASELAVLFETAHDHARAAHYLLLAAHNALRVFAFVETAAIAERAIALLATLPEAAERNATELKLQIALGTASVAIKGYAAAEVERAYARARELCRLLGDSAELASVLFGLFVYYVVVPSHTTSLELGDEMLGIAAREHSPALRLQGLLMHGMTQFWRGRPATAEKQLEEAIGLYRSRRNAVQGTTPFDHGVWSLRYHACSLWLLGYPERAVREAETALAEARQMKNPLTVASTLAFVSMLHHFQRETPAAAQAAAEAVACTREYVLTYWLGFANALHGWTLTQTAHSSGMPSGWDEGVAQIKESLEAHREAGARTFGSFARALLAEAYMLRGLWTEAATAIDDGLALALDADERFWEAELYRLRGDVRAAQGRMHDAVADFEQATVIAAEREERVLELRALTSLCRLAGHTDQRSARARLQRSYEWFTEGFASRDLREARLLLDGAT